MISARVWLQDGTFTLGFISWYFTADGSTLHRGC